MLSQDDRTHDNGPLVVDFDPDAPPELLADDEPDDGPRQPEGPLLPQETWGDRFHRAYRIARRRHGPGFTYRAVAARISEIEPVNDVAIIRLEQRRWRPRQPKDQRLALYCLTLYDFDPLGFGLGDTMFTPVEWNHARILDQDRQTGAWLRRGRAGR